MRLIVTDNDALADTVKTTAHVTNVSPSSAYRRRDPVARRDVHFVGLVHRSGRRLMDATVNYGDGSGTAALSLVGKTFSLSHVYAAAGTFTVTVRVSDDDVTTTATQTVVVTSPAEGVQSAMALVDRLVTTES